MDSLKKESKHLKKALYAYQLMAKMPNGNNHPAFGTVHVSAMNLF